jgi:hypothetical protein
MNAAVPAIYTHGYAARPLRPLHRAIALVVVAACLGVLVTAALLTPNPTGVGTHTALHYQPCDFLARTGVPCPSCGMTTSFAWFARGNLLASLYVQPMGMVLAILTAATFWVALYMAITGIPTLNLVSIVPAKYYLFPFFALAVAAWGWKMLLIARGIDGWR